MRFQDLLRLPSTLLACSSLLSSLALASSQIDVSLHASFAKPPFFLELLETAAAENGSAYFPLIEAISQGRIQNSLDLDQLLYKQFEEILVHDTHILGEAALASWKFALGLRASAPRIEAHYQFWQTAVEESHKKKYPNGFPEGTVIDVWREGGSFCTTPSCNQVKEYPDVTHSSRTLQFDRTYGNPTKSGIFTIYADITHPGFPVAFREWRRANKEEAFRIRYKPAAGTKSAPLNVNGYGVELALKRTDYIVIDDRESDEGSGETLPDKFDKSSEVTLQEDDSSDVKPLSSSELRRLGIGTAGFILASDDPLDTLFKVSGDFPKHAAALAQHNSSKAFMQEHRKNRDHLLPPGANAMWINGVAVMPREVDAFSLLEILRRERKLIASLNALGLSPAEAIGILTYPDVSNTQSNAEPQRYDFRDETEGGKVILWMNDIEKDKRYADWPKKVNALLQRVFPGQLPSIRKDLHNMIFPVDLTNPQDVTIVLENLQSFVKRLVPVRIGLVPAVYNEAAIAQAKVVYHLSEVYGLSTVIRYLQQSVLDRKLSGPTESIFEAVTDSAKVRTGRVVLPMRKVLNVESMDQQIAKTQLYLRRLGADSPKAPIFGNGVAIPKDEEWLQSVSQRLSSDLRIVQEGVFETKYTQDTWLPEIFLNGSSLNRNPLIIPEDESDIKLFSLANLIFENEAIFSSLRPFSAGSSVVSKDVVSVLIIADLNLESGAQLILNASEFGLAHENVEIRFLHRCSSSPCEPSVLVSPESMARIQTILEQERSEFSQDHKDMIGKWLTGTLMSQTVSGLGEKTSQKDFASALGLAPGEAGVLINGRLVAPLPTSFVEEDFELLLAYEHRKRVGPVMKALQAADILDKLKEPLAVAKLVSLVALSTITDVPEGMFDATPEPRTDAYDQWNSTHSCIIKGDKDTASLQIVASIDPSSQVAQRWIPILKTLSELKGVYLRIFLNPQERMRELPIKRFYRYVVNSEPHFGKDGSLQDSHAEFRGMPQDTLLTMAMDVQPSWLVAPKESIHDLDNIKLGTSKGQSIIEASYELEHILIEGHSRDSTGGNIPKGAQLVLGTEQDHDFAGTIIMANLGYFQFKANPGVYSLELQKGASSRIFNIDSTGTMGYSAKAGDNTKEISLTSFQGSTVFPRFSRKAGMELADVLETASTLTETLASKGARQVDDLLAKAGLSNVKTNEYVSKGVSLAQKVLGSSPAAAKSHHAEINIFSVASGHLYERMLNIMIVSVMKNTHHSVKFWFIEQFLSPSFKSFLPTMAAEYNFSYELVTYKWPHWLRAQTEKQRTIWGYKILFLDVLFPLDLDKVIFVDADQIVRTDLHELVTLDLHGAPYGFTPMCDSRVEMEGFRFWKTGYWKNFLGELPYHISALYVVDLRRFRAIAAGDRLRQQYHALSADPNSLANLDQDLPNHMQGQLPIFSLPQEWLWCETWCADEGLTSAKTIDLCNNPLTKEPKLERARRQIPEWTLYDDEIAAVARRSKDGGAVQLGQGDAGGLADRAGKDEL